MLSQPRLADAVALKNIFGVDAPLRRQILLFDREQNVFDLMRLQFLKLGDGRFRRHSGFDDEARAGFQGLGDAVEKLLHVRIREKAKAVAKTIGTVIDATAFDAAHVTQDESNLCYEVSTI